MTRNKNRKRKTRNRMNTDNVNYMKARNAAPDNEDVVALIEFLKSNNDFDSARQTEIHILRQILAFAEKNEIAEADISPNREGGIGLKWGLDDGGNVTIEIEAKSGVSLYRFGSGEANNTILYGMDGDDLSKVYGLMLKHLTGAVASEPEDDATTLEAALRAVFPKSVPEIESEPSEWEIKLKGFADAHLEDIMIEKVSEPAYELTHQLLKNAESLGIKIPEIEALRGGGFELLWKNEEQEIGIDIDAVGHSSLWHTVTGDQYDYFESETVETLREIQILIEDHAPLNLIEGPTYREWTGRYSHESQNRLTLRRSLLVKES